MSFHSGTRRGTGDVALSHKASHAIKSMECDAGEESSRDGADMDEDDEKCTGAMLMIVVGGGLITCKARVKLAIRNF